MEIKEAIKKAIEGGFEQKYAHYSDLKIQAVTFLDPYFWQSFGKAMGWSFIGTSDIPQTHKPQWYYEWHKFIDHLAEGKSIESYFEKL